MGTAQLMSMAYIVRSQGPLFVSTVGGQTDQKDNKDVIMCLLFLSIGSKRCETCMPWSHEGRPCRFVPPPNKVIVCFLHDYLLLVLLCVLLGLCPALYALCLVCSRGGLERCGEKGALVVMMLMIQQVVSMANMHSQRKKKKHSLVHTAPRSSMTLGRAETTVRQGPDSEAGRSVVVVVVMMIVENGGEVNR